jgi:nucleoid DNA-binding protein
MAAPKVKATTKSQIIKNLAESTSLTKKNVTDLLDALLAHIHTDLAKKGVGVFTLPGLCKFKLDVKKAVPAGERKDPFSGQMKFYPAKPAKKVVKARPVKALKDFAATVK